MGMLQDKVAVIIGAAGRDNMGQVIARRFAAEGARVVVAGRDEAALAELAEEIGGLAVRCDITDEGDLAALADAAVARFGHLDIALNATGWGLLKPFLETTKEDIERIAALQFTGTILFSTAILRRMRDDGSIIQTPPATTYIQTAAHDH